MIWINFLHIYQPAHIDAYIIKEATDKSYFRIIKNLEENPHLKFTLNISGCLVLRWEELGYSNLLKRITKLIKNGQIELTGSVAYHIFIPLAPKEEVRRQIKENERILKKYFGKDLQLQGFYFPEMAYSTEMSKFVKEVGYNWIIVDEITVFSKLEENNLNNVFKDSNSGLLVVARSRKYSDSYVPKTILDLLGSEVDFVVTASDGELYGLRHEDPEDYFGQVSKKEEIKTLTISEFIEGKEEKEMTLVNSHWNAQVDDLKSGNNYSLWHNRKNKIQNEIWDLANFAYKLVDKNKNDENYKWAYWHLVRGWSSCTFWWASATDFRSVFGPVSWSPDEIERGVNELIRSIRALENENTREDKITAEKLYIKIKHSVWTKHWKYYWKK